MSGVTIKRTPESFCVEEVLAPEVAAGVTDRPARWAVYRLLKMRLTTPEAASAVARALRVPVGAVQYAGLKDKHAHAAQHLSVMLPHPERAPATLEGLNWQIRRLGWADRALDSSAIRVNRFGITVSQLTGKESDFMAEAARRLAPGGRSGAVRIVNYFGDQRFGSARHGRGFLARRLIAGDFEQALRLAIATPARKDRMKDKQVKRRLSDGWGRWDALRKALPRQPERAAVETLARGGDFRDAFASLPYATQWLAVEAYQSFLWNRIARALIEQTCPEPGRLLRARDRFGRMVFPPADAIGAELADLELPLLGRGSDLRPPWKSAAEKVLAEEGITTADLRIPYLRRPYFGEAPRRLFVDAVGFAMSDAKPDTSSPARGRLERLLTFDLPRGAYATVLLRALGQ